MAQLLYNLEYEQITISLVTDHETRRPRNVCDERSLCAFRLRKFDYVSILRSRYEQITISLVNRFNNPFDCFRLIKVVQ